MKPFETYDQPVLLRVDFNDDAAWAQVRDAVLAPMGDDAWLSPVDDRAYEGEQVADLPAPPPGYVAPVMVVYDGRTQQQPCFDSPTPTRTLGHAPAHRLQ